MTTITYPATPAQRALFTEYELHPANDGFDLSFLFRLDGDVDGTLLGRAVAAVLGGSPGISTTFHRHGTRVTATVSRQEADVTVLRLPDGSDEADVIALVEHDRAAGRIEPDAPHQVRVIIWTTDAMTYMYLRASHLVGDAYSFYHAIGLMSRLYSTPEDQWSEIVARTCALHPGNTQAVSPPDSAVARYADRLADLDRTTHDVLATRRDNGRIVGRSRRLLIEGARGQRLRDSAPVRKNGAASTFFAAYAAVLQQIAGTLTVTIGIPLANRAGQEAKKAIGYFVNTLPLPVTIDAATTWDELCEDVGSGVRLLQACQGLDLRSARHVWSHDEGACDNAVTFYKQGLLLELPGATTESVELGRHGLTYPLTVNVADLGDSYDIEVCTHSSLGDIDVVGLLGLALDRIATASGEPVVVGSLPAATEPAGSDPLRRESLTDLILATRRRHPDRVAVSDAETTHTYAELWARAESVAAWLDNCRATPFVLVRMEKSVDAITAILGVLVSGRAYVPIDPAGAPERERLIRRRVASAQGIEPTTLESLRDLPRGRSDERQSVGPTSPEDPAYVIFTSGSTGEPKGVVVPHGNVTDLLRSTTDLFDLSPADTWSLFHSLAFDFSVWEMFGALSTGGRLEIPAADQIRDPSATAAWLEDRGVTVLNQTPSAFRRFTPLLRAGMTLSSVRLVIFGGEALYSADLEPWWNSAGPGTRLVNMFGITETTVHVTAREMTPEDMREHRSLIGEALSHLRLHVLDGFGREVPVGVAGELVVTGSGVANGYLDRPDLTSARFVPMQVGDRVVMGYRSGDLARRTPEGELVYCGRSDHQVQLRGYRIELGEVEATLLGTPGVDEAVVSLERPTDGEAFLAAWISGPADLEVARDHLTRSLPPYMHPSRLITVPEVPHTQNGKPDLVALRERWGGLDTVVSSSAAPDATSRVDGLAARIASIWEATIAIQTVPTDAHYLEIGGSSMHVMAIHDQIAALPEVADFDVVDLYEHSTPLLLARHLLARNDTDSPTAPDTKAIS